MAKPAYIELPTGEKISILYEDRSVMAIDKPRGWMLVPASWQKTNRNLQMALTSSIAAKDFWARSRNLKFLRFVHRLDADTTGILLFAKSNGAVNTFGDMFEGRKMEKTYLAVAHGAPKEKEWICRLKIGPDLDQQGKMRIDPREGKEAETTFRVLQTVGNATLIEARPVHRPHASNSHSSGRVRAFRLSAMKCMAHRRERNWACERLHWLIRIRSPNAPCISARRLRNFAGSMDSNRRNFGQKHLAECVRPRTQQRDISRRVLISCRLQ